jgi:hypothetical protein
MPLSHDSGKAVRAAMRARVSRATLPKGAHHGVEDITQQLEAGKLDRERPE